MNIPGNILHEKFNQVLELLSLSAWQVNYITARVKEKIKDVLHSRKVQVNSKKEELNEVNKKIDNLEEKLMNDQIDSQTYKKWFKRLRGQKAILEGEIQELNKEQSTSWITAEKLLPSLTNIPEIFEKANIFQKHSFLREVFKAGHV